MGANPLPNPLPKLFALGQDMVDAAHDHGAAIGLVHNTETTIGNDLAAAKAAAGLFGTAKKAAVDAHAALTGMDGQAGKFIKAASAVLAQNLGERWSTAWAPTGFPNQSTAIPSTQDERFSLCGSLKDFFTANPAMEVSTPTVIVTAARADNLVTQLADARQAVKDAELDANTKKIACDAAEAALRDRLRNTISELGELLADDDPLWRTFGLVPPAADQTPAVPTALVLLAAGPGSVHAGWGASARADHYRAYQKVIGVDADYVEVAGPMDCEHTFTGLPSGSSVSLQITAVNTAGESAPCEAKTLVVP
jgi:hypothetical protein